MTLNISFLSTEIQSMPTELSLDLAQHTLGLGRGADALQLVLDASFAIQADPSQHYNLANKLGKWTEQAALIACKAEPASGLRSFLKSLNSKDILTDGFHKGSNNHSFCSKHATHSGALLDSLSKINSDAALDFVRFAPAWCCVHWHNGTDPRHDEGIALAISGRWTQELLDAYLKRDQFAQRLAGKWKETRTIANIVANLFTDFQPEIDKARSAPLVAILIAVFELLPAGQEGAPLAPDGWLHALSLGGFEAGRELAFAKFGKEACMQAAKAHGQAYVDARNALSPSKFSAQRLALCLECHGPADFLSPYHHKLAEPATAYMAKNLSSENFALALDLFLAVPGGSKAIDEDLAHRFWAVREQYSTVRKMGDSLSFLAAEGLIKHAEILLAKRPNLDRKPVKEVLTYMNKRDASKKGTSHSAWEALVLREAVGAYAPKDANPAKKQRL